MAFLHFLRTLLIPLLISLVLYLVLSYGLLPLIRKHRHRYNQYLPLETISTQTDSLRHRAFDMITRVLFPSAWTREYQQRQSARGGALGDNDDEDSLFDEGEGEDMVGFDMDRHRREALNARRDVAGDSERRLSRDLEEGFRDDSDSEAETIGADQRVSTNTRQISNRG